MRERKNFVHQDLLYYRLVALWVVCEVVAGGIIHAWKLPISGLVVGSAAVICICFIGWLFPNKQAILKATVLVCIFKLLLSPHTPPAAYLAVLFQGFVGSLLFSSLKSFKVAAVLLGLIALLESAMQRILILVILYGSKFWDAVNAFVSKLTGSDVVTNYSLLFAAVYVALHAMAGILAGFFAIYLIKKSQEFSAEDRVDRHIATTLESPAKRKRFFRVILILSWMFLLLIIIKPSFLPVGDVLTSSTAFIILIRSVLLLLSWYLLVNPLLKYYLKKWLHKQEQQSQKELVKIVQILPSTQQLVLLSWRSSAGTKGYKRILRWAKLVMSNTLHA